MMSGKFKQMSNSQLRKKIKELEAKGNLVEAGKYKKELEKRSVNAGIKEDYEPEILEEGLFKKPNVNVEVNYGDWEADCTVWEVGNDIKPLEVINIELPEKFHASSSNKDLSKAEWEKMLLSHVKKELQPKLKKYNVKRIDLH